MEACQHISESAGFQIKHPDKGTEYRVVVSLCVDTFSLDWQIT